MKIVKYVTRLPNIFTNSSLQNVKIKYENGGIYVKLEYALWTNIAPKENSSSYKNKEKKREERWRKGLRMEKYKKLERKQEEIIIFTCVNQ